VHVVRGVQFRLRLLGNRHWLKHFVTLLDPWRAWQVAALVVLEWARTIRLPLVQHRSSHAVGHHRDRTIADRG